MNTIAVWVLVIAAAGQGQPVISLPVADLASCQRMQEVVKHNRVTQCVQVSIPVNSK
jgi:hypothetical protein